MDENKIDAAVHWKPPTKQRKLAAALTKPLIPPTWPSAGRGTTAALGVVVVSSSTTISSYSSAAEAAPQKLWRFTKYAAVIIPTVSLIRSVSAVTYAYHGFRILQRTPQIDIYDYLSKCMSHPKRPGKDFSAAGKASKAPKADATSTAAIAAARPSANYPSFYDKTKNTTHVICVACTAEHTFDGNQIDQLVAAPAGCPNANDTPPTLICCEEMCSTRAMFEQRLRKHRIAQGEEDDTVDRAKPANPFPDDDNDDGAAVFGDLGDDEDEKAVAPSTSAAFASSAATAFAASAASSSSSSLSLGSFKTPALTKPHSVKPPTPDKPSASSSLSSSSSSSSASASSSKPRPSVATVLRPDWECTVCLFGNKPAMLACEKCLTTKPRANHRPAIPVTPLTEMTVTSIKKTDFFEALTRHAVALGYASLVHLLKGFNPLIEKASDRNQWEALSLAIFEYRPAKAISYPTHITEGDSYWLTSNDDYLMIVDTYDDETGFAYNHGIQHLRIAFGSSFDYETNTFHSNSTDSSVWTPEFSESSPEMQWICSNLVNVFKVRRRIVHVFRVPGPPHPSAIFPLNSLYGRLMPFLWNPTQRMSERKTALDDYKATDKEGKTYGFKGFLNSILREASFPRTADVTLAPLQFKNTIRHLWDQGVFQIPLHSLISGDRYERSLWSSAYLHMQRLQMNDGKLTEKEGENGRHESSEKTKRGYRLRAWTIMFGCDDCKDKGDIFPRCPCSKPVTSPVQCPACTRSDTSFTAEEYDMTAYEKPEGVKREIHQSHILPRVWGPIHEYFWWDCIPTCCNSNQMQRSLPRTVAANAAAASASDPNPLPDARLDRRYEHMFFSILEQEEKKEDAHRLIRRICLRYFNYLIQEPRLSKVIPATIGTHSLIGFTLGFWGISTDIDSADGAVWDFLKLDPTDVTRLAALQYH